MNQELKDQFSVLSESEIQKLVNAYPLITILIAGADGDIDSRELEWASKLSNIRSYNESYELNPLFKEVEMDFDATIADLMKEVPGSVDTRYDWISPRLSELNDIIAKLENSDAFVIYKSLTSFAKHIARAEGGFLRMGSINSEEAKLIKLPMINEIVLEDQSEEE